MLAVPWWGAASADAIRGLIDAAPQIDCVVLYASGTGEEAQQESARSMVSVLMASDRFDGLVVGAAITDALKEVAGDIVVRSLDRRRLIIVSPPAAIKAGFLRAALSEDDADVSVDLLIARGGRLGWRAPVSPSAGSS